MYEETETDLFGEQCVLCGGVVDLMRCGFEVLGQWVAVSCLSRRAVRASVMCHLLSAVVRAVDGDVRAAAELDHQGHVRVVIDTDIDLEQRVLLDVRDELALAVYLW